MQGDSPSNPMASGARAGTVKSSPGAWRRGYSACEVRAWALNRSPFFHRVKVRLAILRSMMGDVRSEHLPAEGGCWISLACSLGAMVGRRAGRRLDLVIYGVWLWPTETGCVG